jgi:hypothetical protein
MDALNTQSNTKVLCAGPVRMKFADGELRYLRVGDKEIIRRIYYAVRVASWDTPMPKFSRVEIDAEENRFDIRMDAVCRREDCDFEWKGRITGAEDGTITFEIEGKANATFETPRIGFCVLYGSEAVAGQAFELAHADGTTTSDAFPHPVKPTLVAEYHRTLGYVTGSGIEVTVDTHDSPMRMEDQRNFGDNSFKSFTDNQFGDGQADAGTRASEKLTLTVRAEEPVSASPSGPIAVAVNPGAEAFVIPRIEIGTDTPFVDYSRPSRNRDDYKLLEKVTFGVIPGAHLYDNDTYMENCPAIVPEVATLRSFASCSSIRIDPISMKAPYPTADMKLEGGEALATAWCARMVKYLALAKVDEAAFDIEEAAAQDVVKSIAALEGKTLVPSDIGPHEVVDSFGVLVDDGCRIWVINKTLDTQQVVLSGLAESEVSLAPLEVRVFG